MIFDYVLYRPADITLKEVLHHLDNPIHIGPCCWAVPDFLLHDLVEDVYEVFVASHLRVYIRFVEKDYHHSAGSKVIDVMLFWLVLPDFVLRLTLLEIRVKVLGHSLILFLRLEV